MIGRQVVAKAVEQMPRDDREYYLECKLGEAYDLISDFFNRDKQAFLAMSNLKKFVEGIDFDAQDEM